MEIRVRNVGLDGLESLHHGLRALGFPGPARDMLASTVMQGHFLLTGLSPEALEALRTLLREPEMPRAIEGTTPGAVLVSGRLGACKHLGERLQKRAEVPGAAVAGGKLLRACFFAGQRAQVRVGKLVLGEGPAQVMGILNVTPDSFSDGGSLQTADELLRRAEALVDAGATILDVGGESTRPKGLYGEGARPVDAAEERARVEPAIRVLRKRFPDVAISVDTSKAEVARAAIGEGADLINDVRALADDELARVVAQAHLPCCLMHMPAEPDEMARHTNYEDVVGEVAERLIEAVDAALARGVRQDGILVDPGFGFGKTYGQNLMLLRELGTLRAAVGRPLLVGTSRKGFLGKATGREVGEREAATAASVAIAIAAGASVVRIHDAAACQDAVRLANAMVGEAEGGSLFVDDEAP